MSTLPEQGTKLCTLHEAGIFLMRRLQWVTGVLRLLFMLTVSCGLLSVSVAHGDTARRHPIMRLDPDSLRQWNEAYKNAPTAYLKPELKEAAQRRGALSLMSYSPWNSGNIAQRNQNICGDCWVWTGTGLAEFALSVQNGVKQRLSVQLFDSCWTGDNEKACCGGFLDKFAHFYAVTKKYMVPWENANAWFLDGTIDEDNDCSRTNATCETIATSPQFAVEAASMATVPTTGSGTTQSQAIANMKNVLGQNKAIAYSMSLPTGPDWDAFYDFWNNQDESVVFDPGQYSGQNWDTNNGGTHDEIIVGYNDDDPDNSYWIVLNSWGASTNRQNGVWRLNMNTNYAAYYIDTDSSQQPMQQFSTLSITFSLPASVGSLNVTLQPATAAAAGARWRVDNGAWQESGASLPWLSAGSHAVSFLPLAGFVAPADRTVTVSQGGTSAVTGTYAAMTGGGASLASLDIPAAAAVSAFSRGFDEQFTGGLGDWTANGFGSWTVAGGMASVTGTSSGKYCNLAYGRGTFSNFDFSVSMRRSNDLFDDANAVYFRGVSTPQSSNGRWNAGYRFAYANNRKYQISSCSSGGSWTTLVGWTESTAIIPLDWNVLRVVASGSSLTFFINGTQVYTTTNTLFPSGQVGIEMYDGTGGTLDVDAALLSTVLPN